MLNNKLVVIVNKDKSAVKRIRKAIKDNGGYCPCSVDKNDDTKCMCKFFRDMETVGSCHCGLYKKVRIGE